MDVFAALAVAFWSMLPAYVPNNVAVLAGGGPPVDGGRTLGDRRLLGDGKTWRGTIAGVVGGSVVALALDALAPTVRAATAIGALPTFPLAIVVALPSGAMLGDIVASFLKRRLDRERGASVPGLDQLDFVVGALGLAAVTDYRWFASTFTSSVLVVVLVITPVLHLGTNYVAYLLDLKQVPW
jgi:CDP-2,3-bis-(O-geranylgeranyl)-sn-glycerol synthase